MLLSSYGSAQSLDELRRAAEIKAVTEQLLEENVAIRDSQSVVIDSLQEQNAALVQDTSDYAEAGRYHEAGNAACQDDLKKMQRRQKVNNTLRSVFEGALVVIIIIVAL